MKDWTALQQGRADQLWPSATVSFYWPKLRT